MIGCGLVVGGGPLDDQEDPIAEDLAEYEQLVATLEAEREQALGEQATALATAGPWLAWVDGQTLGLRRYPDGLELSLPAHAPSFRVGISYVITSERVDAAVIHRGYALPSGELIDELQLVAPPSEPWWVPALLEDTAVLLDGQTVRRWELGVEPPVELGTLAEAGIAVEQVEQIEAVVREGEVLVLRAEGRLWILELDSFVGAAVAELDALLDVDQRGILFTHGDALWLHPFEGPSVRIDAAIAQSGWSLNPTFANIHAYAGLGASLAEDRVLYIGSAGLFAYALDHAGPEAITPILIEPRWDVAAGIPRIEYREPRFAGGTVFVRGLIDAHGEVGETGPIFAAPSST